MFCRLRVPNSRTNMQLSSTSASIPNDDRAAELDRSLALIDGLEDFLIKAHEKNIPMAIGSAAINFNIDFVLDQLHIRKYFKGIVSADDVDISKPHPETFLKAAALLNTDPKDCIVFEDAPKGVEAARNAGIPCIVLTTMHNRNEFPDTSNVLSFIKDYTDPDILSMF